ncbi:MAG TPA: excinuclease ABC subunit UvrA [Clostridiaceae bacterium]|nr:excinuclease ABC subunit UvrA [Clostridiaceae bacterium]
MGNNSIKENYLNYNQADLAIYGARVHNLKNISLKIPRNKLTVITGLSGSGKSSLAFDTIYAEGQRRYVESLSSYARQFLGQMEKPDVDRIEGLSPAIAIDQKSTSNNPRSTVGTVTEIYDYLRLLYARAGTVHCPQCGRVIEQQTIDQMIDRIMQYPAKTKMILYAPIVRERKGEFKNQFNHFRREGYVRIRVDGEILYLDDLPQDFKLEKNIKHSIEVVVDRLVMREGIESRLADSLETCLNLSNGLALINIIQSDSEQELSDWHLYSQHFNCPDCDISISEISPRSFSFNNPIGACSGCDGLGEMTEIDPELVVYDPGLSLNDGAIQAIGWKFSDRKSWARGFIEALAKRYDFSLDMPWQDLPQQIRDIVLFGNDGEILSIDTSNSKFNRGTEYKRDWIGVIPSMTKRYAESSGDSQDYYERYVSVTPCPICHGARLNQESLSVRIGGLNIYELTLLSISECKNFLDNVQLDSYRSQIALPILRELSGRLQFLLEVGLDYLTLARASASLSGGEAQRIRLATQIGSGLTGVLYVLDEPSIGLHQRDNSRLLKTLKHLRDLGNTVIVVEHDEETIWEADNVVDIGPGAGAHGGQVVAAGRPEDILANPVSVTGQYLSGIKKIPIPEKRRQSNGYTVKLTGCHQNNLKYIDVNIPLGVFVCVTGVSGSGKSSLINGILLKKMAEVLNGARKFSGPFKSISGLEYLDKVIAIDQAPIGRTPRSNPATYTGVFTEIRDLFAETKTAKARGYKKGRFSFNVKGGRCEACKGDGVNRIEMHFLPDVYVTCEVCKGKRYNRETLEVKYKEKNISDILDMTVEDAYHFFRNIPKIVRKLQTMLDVGLGYIKLGQPSTQLSGGEAQRVKLATELSRTSTGKTFYILDEPTTGLHSADVHRLVDILQRLTEKGNSVLVIEHNLDVIKTADYIIDLGPEGGDGGGEIIAQGTPEEVAEIPGSYTGKYLKQILQRKYPTIERVQS